MIKKLMIGAGLIVGLFIVLVVVLSLTVGDTSEDSSPSNAGVKATNTPRPAHTPTPGPLAISVEDIYQAYQENEARANVTYKKIKLDLYFRVDEIEDRYVVQDLGPFDEAQLKFHEADLIAFNKGTRRIGYAS